MRIYKKFFGGKSYLDLKYFLEENFVFRLKIFFGVDLVFRLKIFFGGGDAEGTLPFQFFEISFPNVTPGHKKNFLGLIKFLLTLYWICDIIISKGDINPL